MVYSVLSSRQVVGKYVETLTISTPRSGRSQCDEGGPIYLSRLSGAGANPHEENLSHRLRRSSRREEDSVNSLPFRDTARGPSI